MDLGKLNTEGFGSSYSQLFQSSGVLESMAKLNDMVSPDKVNGSLDKSKYSNPLTALVDPRKFKDDDLKEKKLVAKNTPKDPKVQVVKAGQPFDRRKTFIKNWEYEEEEKQE